MTPEKLEFARTFTDREVMSSAISQLRAMAIDNTMRQLTKIRDKSLRSVSCSWSLRPELS